MISYCNNDLRRMNRTARRAGAVGYNAVTPRYVATIADDGDLVLDYGCGKSTAHGRRIADQTNAEVHFYDIGDNARGLAQFWRCRGSYDLAYASNVLNVQLNGHQVANVFRELYGAVHHAGFVVFNYPQTPRHSGLSADHVLRIATAIFGLRPQAVPGFSGVYQVMKAY